MQLNVAVMEGMPDGIFEGLTLGNAVGLVEDGVSVGGPDGA